MEFKKKPLIDMTDSGKSCGGCVACCHSVPVKEIQLGAFMRCPHLHGPLDAKVGCSIYPTRPGCCSMWNCQWLAEKEWPAELRPDRCGIVVDIMPDIARINGKEFSCMQLWVLPGHEEDFLKDGPGRNIVLSCFAQGYAVLWRIAEPGNPGGQLARLLWQDDTGIHYSDPSANEDDSFLGGSGARAVRAIALQQWRRA